MKYSWYLPMYKMQTKRKVAQSWAEQSRRRNEGASVRYQWQCQGANRHTHAHTHTKHAQSQNLGGEDEVGHEKATLCSYRKSFWQTLCDSRCIFPINFHLQHSKFASFSQLHFDMLQFSSLPDEKDRQSICTSIRGSSVAPHMRQ